MVGPGIFDSALAALLLIGAILGAALCGLGWLAYWLWWVVGQFVMLDRSCT